MLVRSGHGKPTQTTLRRAVSTAYYALFHSLAGTCANLLIGGPGSLRSRHAWREVYRALAHGTAKGACEHRQVLNKFPVEIIDFAEKFIEMQRKRHDADYDPAARFYKSDVVMDIDAVELVIARFEAASTKDRRAFASWVLFKNAKRTS